MPLYENIEKESETVKISQEDIPTIKIQNTNVKDISSEIFDGYEKDVKITNETNVYENDTVISMNSDASSIEELFRYYIHTCPPCLPYIEEPNKIYWGAQYSGLPPHSRITYVAEKIEDVLIMYKNNTKNDTSPVIYPIDPYVFFILSRAYNYINLSLEMNNKGVIVFKDQKFRYPNINTLDNFIKKCNSLIDLKSDNLYALSLANNKPFVFSNVLDSQEIKESFNIELFKFYYLNCGVDSGNPYVPTEKINIYSCVNQKMNLPNNQMVIRSSFNDREYELCISILWNSRDTFPIVSAILQHS